MSAPLYLVRHGQTHWNAGSRFQGQADTDINETGRAQADRNGRCLAELVGQAEDFDFVASPLRRTRETMERIRRAMGLPAEGYRTDARLMELHFGDWQGSTLEEIEAREPGATAARHADKWNFLPPGASAESYHLLTLRVQPWLEAIERPTICVTHGGIIRSVFRLIGGYSAIEAAEMEVRQDRLVRKVDGRLEWV